MRIGQYLNRNGVAFDVFEHSPAYTAQEVAAEEHVSGKMMAKSVLLRDEMGYFLCVLPAHEKLDMDKVARTRHASEVSLADETEMAKVFPDVEVGAEPPFGNLYDLDTYVDEDLAANTDIVFQAGTHRKAIRMRFVDYAQLAQPMVASVSAHV